MVIQVMKQKFPLVLLVTFLSLPQLVESQNSGKVSRLVFMGNQSQPGGRFESFRQGLRDFGYVDGKNIQLEYRGHEDRAQLTVIANELSQKKPDIVITQGAGTRAAHSIVGVPIVFGFSGDPVEAGLIKSLARPGGNMTGVTMLAFELVGKRLEFLKQAAPKVSRVSVLSSPAHPGEQRELSESQKTAHNVGVTLLYHQVSNTTDVNAAFEATSRENANALLAFPDPVTSSHRVQISEFAVKHRLPSVFGWGDYVEAGGLMAYGPDHNVLWRRLAVYVDKILKGAKPGELPVQQPTKFELVVNLKTAKHIGLVIPPQILARADRVIR